MRKRNHSNVAYVIKALKSPMKINVERIHESKKDIKCEICDYRFSVKNSLRQHILSINDEK